ncbi:MAG: universal stress protein [Natrialbaceae archaeon]|nr:universal stress protein [Natrialbaceae archaeon]
MPTSSSSELRPSPTSRDVRSRPRPGPAIPPARLSILQTTKPVDRIVIGSHGRTGLSRVLLGSVAEEVARRAPIPVTIVR